MAKKQSTLISMVATLVVITGISGFSLGVINELTTEPKNQARLKKKLEAIAAVVPAFDNNPADEAYILPHAQGLDAHEVFPAKKDGKLVGVAVSSSSGKGYTGPIKIMVGFTPGGDIINVSVLEQKETPGLGTKIEEPDFIGQFKGKNPGGFRMLVKNDGGEIDAITAATISSRAFCEAAQLAFDAYMDNLKK
jgi:Na+-translocating ferredoxin:NAD+ oxidoreductase subunit G